MKPYALSFATKSPLGRQSKTLERSVVRASKLHGCLQFLSIFQSSLPDSVLHWSHCEKIIDI